METKANCYIDPLFLSTLCHTQIQGCMSFLLWRDVLNRSLPGGHLGPCGHSGTPILKTKDCCGLLHPCSWAVPSSCSPWLTVTLVYLCVYNFITPTHYSDIDSHELLPLVYIDMSCNHFVYTAGLSGSVKGYYATKEKKWLSFNIFK